MGRLRPADVLAGIGGAVLLGSLWLDWYGLDPGAFALADGATLRWSAQLGGVAPLSAWQAFSVIDILLALVAALAIGVPLVTLASRGPAKPVAFAILATVGGALAVLLVLYRIVDQPGSNALVAVRSGAWIGLAGAILTLVGAFLALADDRTPGATPPQVPRRPAP